jgi:hypothetical protein
MSEEKTDIEHKNYPAIIGSLKSPLSVFGLAMLICNAVFSISAAFINDNALEAFVYSIHTFLAIVFAFVIIAIWSPRSLYHPSELAGIGNELPEIKNSRMIITTIFMIAAFSYAGFQLIKSLDEECKQDKTSQAQ